MQRLVPILVLLLCGCPKSVVTEQSPDELRADVATSLRPVADLQAEVMLQQRVTIRWSNNKEQRSFDAVLQFHGGKVVVVGLGPFGRPGFSIEYSDATGIRVENRTGHEIPFSPAHIVSDVQRTFYPWLSTDRGDSMSRSGSFGGFEIEERFKDDRLYERSFRMSKSPERGRLRIVYTGWSDTGIAPKHVRIHNQWFGYQLDIETLSEKRL